jgi:hypothetical protein
MKTKQVPKAKSNKRETQALPTADESPLQCSLYLLRDKKVGKLLSLPEDCLRLRSALV